MYGTVYCVSYLLTYILFLDLIMQVAQTMRCPYQLNSMDYKCHGAIPKAKQASHLSMFSFKASKFSHGYYNLSLSNCLLLTYTEGNSYREVELIKIYRSKKKKIELINLFNLQATTTLDRKRHDKVARKFSVQVRSIHSKLLCI